MAADMEDAFAQKKEYQMQVDRKEAKRQVNKKKLVDQQRLRAADLSEEEDLDNADIKDGYTSKGKRGLKKITGD